MDDDALLAEQRAYYRARAPEYDEWWLRQGAYDRGEQEAQEWRQQVATVEAALAAFGATGDVLELAGGTGWWTARLAETATHLTVVDASSETLELNRARVGPANVDHVDYVVADLFDWKPTRQYDAVFFSFWLSHVPRARFGAFWTLVRACLGPGGRVFLIDNCADPEPRPRGKDPYVVAYGPDLHLRRVSDGSNFRVVKVLYEPDELQSLIEAEGWRADIQATRRFLFGTAATR